MSAPAERHESLWWLSVAPAIWLLHFLTTYTTVAVFCAKTPSQWGDLSWTRWAIALYTALAAAGIVATGLHGLRRHQLGPATAPHDIDSPEDRHRFIGFATLLLSGLGLLGVVFVALPMLFIDTCR